MLYSSISALRASVMFTTIRRYRLALLWAIYFGVLFGSRRFVELNMVRHMVWQFPALLIGGFRLGKYLPACWRLNFERYDQLGLSGMVLFMATTSIWMIPLAIDLAVQIPFIDTIKFISLWLTGLVLSQSWQRAGDAVQAFFLMSWAMMVVTIGMLYQETEIRLCSSYLTNEQADAGTGLMMTASMLVVIWFFRLFHCLHQQERSAVLAKKGRG
ncbi:hypothetical protein ACO0K0_19995 [Undibacterium sp. SXout11W]|uniref:hypothetical protein n=1 Tax=Undibacterium sp. SXout11W TaxID=3413050 RepID=UPI003BF34886